MKRNNANKYFGIICCLILSTSSMAQGIRVNLKNGLHVDYKASDVESVTTYADDSNAPQVKTITVGNVSFKMIYVEGGSFVMGAEADNIGASYNNPAHDVYVNSFFIGETEVTQELWEAINTQNPSWYTDSKLKPVEDVSWTECQDFIKKLSVITGLNFRMPTEAEWEFAARGGVSCEGYQYSGGNVLNDVGWFFDNSPEEKTHEVAGKKPNELGIYDMSGNVWEWCEDFYDDYYYFSSPYLNPLCTSSSVGNVRCLRGGSFRAGDNTCKISVRNFNEENYRYGTVGLRLVLEQKE